METKTFKSLSIGDTFYKVFTNHEGLSNPKYEKIIVRDIKAEKNNKDVVCIKINKYSGYNSDSYHLFSYPIKDCDKTIIECGSDGYFATSLKDVAELLGRAGLSYIRNIENKIVDHQKEIMGIRKTYYEYLNNLTKLPVDELKKNQILTPAHENNN